MLTSPEKPKPTDEQVEILDRVRTTGDNLLINALAGSGKTSTIEMAIDATPATEPCLYLAFNRAIVKEAKKRLRSTTEVSTLNSLGHRVWAEACGHRLTVAQDKLYIMLQEQVKQLKGDDSDEAWDNFSDILQACKLAKHLGYIPKGAYTHVKPLTNRAGLQARLENQLSDLCFGLVDNVLKASIQAAYLGSIDFDDQIYMPALFGGSFPRFPNVYVDEDQDLSPTNIEMLRKAARDSRLGAVGDRWQSIYYFRGSETNGVDKLKDLFKMYEMPLSMSFRCPENIVKQVHWHVPSMRWLKEGGVYKSVGSIESDSIPDGAAIICRNNAPLLKMAFGLLGEKRSVELAGTDVGPKIIRLLKKIGKEDDTQSMLIGKINMWEQEKLATSNSAANTQDTAECMRIFATWGKDLYQAIQYAEHIFKQHGAIQLTTGHKSKGKEWDVAYHLDPQLIKLEGDDEKAQQERNLKYVITTRAKQEMYTIQTELLPWL